MVTRKTRLGRGKDAELIMEMLGLGLLLETQPRFGCRDVIESSSERQGGLEVMAMGRCSLGREAERKDQVQALGPPCISANWLLLPSPVVSAPFPVAALFPCPSAPLWKVNYVIAPPSAAGWDLQSLQEGRERTTKKIRV